MGAPLSGFVGLGLAKAFNAHDVEAAPAMYYPDVRSAKEVSHA
jgi:hypothetical protein